MAVSKLNDLIYFSTGINMGDFVKISLQICSALAARHDDSLVYGDVKEMNIIVDEKGNFSLADIESIGVPAYQTPESGLGKAYGQADDIYAFGMVLYKLLNNMRLPFLPDAPAAFTEEEARNAEEKRKKGDIPPIPYHAKRRLGDIVLKALAKKDIRYGSIAELKSDLSAYFTALTVIELDAVLIEAPKKVLPMAEAPVTAVSVEAPVAPTATPVTVAAPAPVVPAPQYKSGMSNKTIALLAGIALFLFVGAVAAILLIAGLLKNDDVIEVSSPPAVVAEPEAVTEPTAEPMPNLNSVAGGNRLIAARDHTVALRDDGTLLITGIAGRTVTAPGGQIGHFTDLMNVHLLTGYYNHLAVIDTDGDVLTSMDIRKREDFVDIIDVAIGSSHIIALKSDGTVIADGYDSYGETDVTDWTDIVAVYAGSNWSLGIKSNGTVVAAGNNDKGQCNVSEWRNIESIVVGYDYTLGITTDGKVVGQGGDWWTPIEISDFDGCVQIAGSSDHLVGLRPDGTVIAQGTDYSYQCDVGGWNDIIKVAASHGFTMGLKSDGTIVTTGSHYEAQFDPAGYDGYAIDILVTDGYVAILSKDQTISATGYTYYSDLRMFPHWLSYYDITNIRSIATGRNFSAVLTDDGEVIVYGDNSNGQWDAEDWPRVISIEAGDDFILGITEDGRVLNTNTEGYYGYNLSSWQDIIAVCGGRDFAVGLKSDGTLLAEGENNSGQLNFRHFTDIIAIAAGDRHLVALKKDGTLEAIGSNSYEQCDVYDWTDIIKIDAGDNITVGLKSDGTVLATGDMGWRDSKIDVSYWTDIVEIAAGQNHVVGLKADGTFVATGSNELGQINVSDWTVR